jgi:hypothetical protein
MDEKGGCGGRHTKKNKTKKRTRNTIQLHETQGLKKRTSMGRGKNEEKERRNAHIQRRADQGRGGGKRRGEEGNDNEGDGETKKRRVTKAGSES